MIKPKQQEGNAFTSGVWILTGTAGIQISRIVVLMILARLLAPEAFGIISAFQVIVGISEVLVECGFGAALIQSPKLSQGLPRAVSTYMIALAGVISVAICLCATSIANLLSTPELSEILPYISIALLSAAASSAPRNLLARDERFKDIAIIELASYILGYGLIAVLLALLGFGYWSLLVATVGQSLIRTTLFLIVRPVFPTAAINPAGLSAIASFGVGTLGAEILNRLARRADNLIVVSTLGAAALGLYSRAYTIMDAGNSLAGTTLYRALFPSMSKQRRCGASISEQQSKYLTGQAAAAACSIPMIIAVTLEAKAIILVLLGENWIDITPTLAILGSGIFFRVSYKVGEAVIISAGAVFRNLLRQALFALTIIFGVLFGSKFGLPGVSAAVVFAMAVNWISATLLSSSLLQLRLPRVSFFLSPFVFSGVLALGAAYLSLVLTEQKFFDVSLSHIIISCAALLIYLGALLFLFRGHPAVKSIASSLSRQSMRRRQ